jgi:hypothetical protein
MMQPDRIEDYLQRLTPLVRSDLLTELERLESCGSEMPGSAEILDKLRAEFGKDGSSHNRRDNPSKYFFASLEPLLVDGAPEHDNSGRILRGSLSPIWQWISRDLLPTITRDYVAEINGPIATDDPRKARQIAAAFQTKIVKSLQGTLSSPDGADQARTRLATYTASRAAYSDLTRMLCVLRAHDILLKFGAALPATIQNFDDAQVAKVTALLDELGKNRADVIPFALALVAGRLRTPWQLIRLAIKAAPDKNAADAADIAAVPYAITLSMVLDRLDDKRSALRTALRNNRVLVAKEILTDIYNTEHELRVGIDLLGQTELRERLDRVMDAITTLVETEVRRFPDNVGHVLGSRSLRSHRSPAGGLAYLASKGRDAMSNGADFCRKLIRPA